MSLAMAEQFDFSLKGAATLEQAVQTFQAELTKTVEQAG